VRFASLGSGSLGNAYLVETAQIRVLIDCGFAAREIERRLDGLAVEPTSLDAILVTHEHTDHIRGLSVLARRYQLPTWMTYGTYRGSRCGQLPELHLINTQTGRFRVGDLEILPYTVPHDAREPCQYVLRNGKKSLGLLTDAGHITPHVLAHLRDCDSLILEFNHDTELLAGGPYPPHLQARVGGNHGHLNNQQSVALLAGLEHGRLQHLMAAHLSEKNNTPAHVRTSLLEQHQQLEARLSFAAQHNPSGWCTISPS
jgi:phosphoribosyl 1,2-cyclic phosphodiesterase